MARTSQAEEPLRTVGLLEAAHQYSLQDLCGSASTPIPTLLPTQEWLGVAKEWPTSDRSGQEWPGVARSGQE